MGGEDLVPAGSARLRLGPASAKGRTRALPGVLLSMAMVCQSAAAGALALTDQAGRSVTLPAPAQRVAAVSINQEETLLALQAWERVVSLPATSFGNPLIRYLELPAKPVTAFTEAAGVSLEGLAGLNPDLVVTWTGNRLIIPRLEEIGWPTLAVHPRTLGDLRRMLALLGAALGRDARASELNDAILELERRLAERLGPHDGPRARVLWLGAQPNIVYGRKWIFHDVIRSAGAEDVTRGLEFLPFTVEISPEQILVWRPDVIVIVGAAPYGPEVFYEDARLAGVPAVRDRRIYKPPAGRANHGPFATLLAIMTAHWCYPEHLGAGETLALLDEYHRLYYGVPFTAVHPGFISAAAH